MISQILIVLAILLSLFLGYSIGYWWCKKSDGDLERIGDLFIDGDLVYIAFDKDSPPHSLRSGRLVLLKVIRTNNHVSNES